jgi:hypothetical protein
MSLSSVHELGAATLEEKLYSDSSDDMEETDLRHWKKKRRARLLNSQTSLKSIFYMGHLKLADDSTEPSSTPALTLEKCFNTNLDSPIQC